MENNQFEPWNSIMEPWNRHTPITDDHQLPESPDFPEHDFFRKGIRPISATAWILGALIALAVGLLIFLSGCNRRPTQTEMRRAIKLQQDDIKRTEKEWIEFEKARRQFTFGPKTPPPKNQPRLKPVPWPKERTAQ